MKKRKCARCKWADNSKKVNALPFWGNPHADIVLVGEAFGKTEMEQYLKTGVPEPFIGKSGNEVLGKLLDLAGLQKPNLAIMNAIRCWLPRNPTPTKAELDACFPFTFFDLKTIKPKLVVALGASAFYQLTGKTEFQPYIGKLLWSDKVQNKVYVTYHPAACVYDPRKWKTIRKCFRNLKSKVEEAPQEVKHFNYEYIQSVERFYEILPELESDEYIYLDTETTGLNVYHDNLTLIQLANTPNMIYILDASILEDIKSSLKNLLETKKIIGQGWEFDAKVLYTNLDINIQNWYFDTCLAEYVISGMKNNDLTYLVMKYVPESYGYDDKIKAVGGAHKIKDKNELLQYAADDVGVLFKIKEEQAKQINSDFLFYDILMPTNKILTDMSLRGVKYDIDKLIELDKRYDKKAKRLLLKAQNIEGVKKCEEHFREKFNPRSYQMIKWLLLEYYQLPVLKRTKKDSPSIGQKEMKKYAELYDNEYCKLMEKYGSIQTLRNDFLSGVIPKLINNIAHTTYSLHATESGRPNSKAPNLLNLPRSKDIKECIIPRNGYVFVGGDESQMEIRVASVVYDEPNLIEICNDDIKDDMHSYITARAFNKTYDEVYNGYKNGNTEMIDLRTAGKSITFGILYQMGPASLAYELGIDKDKAIKFIEDYYSGFPSLRKNIDATKQFLIEHGYVDNYFGFRRRWKDHSEENHNMLREGVNHKVQSTAAYLLYLAKKAIDKRFKNEGLDAYLVLQVYDSLVAEVKEDDYSIDRVIEIMTEEMQNVNKPFEGLNRVKLKTDINVGYSLAEI